LCIGQTSFDHQLHKVGLIVDHHFSLITAAAAITHPLLQMMMMMQMLISYITAGVVAAAAIILLELLLFQPPLHCFLMDLAMQLVTLVCATHTWPEIFPSCIMLLHHNIIVIAAHYILPTFLPMPLLLHHESSPISLQLMCKKT
jgi:hypothetical protein